MRDIPWTISASSPLKRWGREDTAYVRKNGNDIVGTYIDKVYSAKADKRDEFHYMIKTN